MRPQLIMFLGAILAAGTLISMTFGGGWFGSTDVSTINAVAGFKSATIVGSWSVPVPNIDFVTSGLAALLKWDFAFFDGSASLIRWFLIFIVSAGVTWGLFSVMIYTISGLFPRLGR